MGKQAQFLAGWVVYKPHSSGPRGPNAVCEQLEWDAMERASPGRQVMVRRGIANEAEAERVARESPGGTLLGKIFLKSHQSPVAKLGR